jgi:anti-sigma B factor antagonist
MDHPEVRLDASVGEQSTTVTVAGDLDMLTAPRFRDFTCAKVSERPQPLVIDMTGVGFVDSTGISALVAIRLHAKRLDQTVVVEPSRRVHAALKLAQLSDVFQADHPDDPGSVQPA